MYVPVCVCVCVRIRTTATLMKAAAAALCLANLLRRRQHAHYNIDMRNNMAHQQSVSKRHLQQQLFTTLRYTISIRLM